MTASKSVDPASFLREQLESASPDLLREMVKTFADALMSAEADAVCGAPYGVRSDERTNSRNGYRARDWDTRAGTIELAIPKLRSGSYFPDWLLQHRRRAEQALVSVVATSYLLGVSTRRVEKLVEQLGVAQLSKSQVSEMATHLDAQVEAFRSPVGAQNSDNYRDLLFRKGLCGSLIFVDKSAEDRFSAYPALFVEIDDGGWWAWR